MLTTIALRLDPETRFKLDLLAESTGNSRAAIVAEAVRRFVNAELAEIAALAEAQQAAATREEEKPPLPERWNIIV